jgi:hypothetical protein
VAADAGARGEATQRAVRGAAARARLALPSAPRTLCTPRR